MMKKIATLLLAVACALPAQARNPPVWLDSDMGPSIIEFDAMAEPTER